MFLTTLPPPLELDTKIVHNKNLQSNVQNLPTFLIPIWPYKKSKLNISQGQCFDTFPIRRNVRWGRTYGVKMLILFLAGC